jgi:phosphoribosylanthranilate isomerase
MVGYKAVTTPPTFPSDIARAEPRKVFRTKICGITRVEDALLAVEAGADAIGLNFVASSPRCLDLPTAEEISALVKDRVSLVGVFVNMPESSMRDLATALSLDYIQLHGDEPVEMLQALAPWRTIRAVRFRSGDEHAILDLVAAGHRLGAPPAAVLVDAFQPGKYGGTGKTVNWSAMRNLRNMLRASHECPVVLAGGLDAENVREAILQSHCDAVDVASGVESQAGVKDSSKVRKFVTAARLGWSELTGGNP